MSFLDFMSIVKHYRKTISLILVVFLLVGVVCVLPVKPSYKAAATVSACDPSGVVSANTLISMIVPISNEVIDDYSDDIKVQIAAPSPSTAPCVFTITAEGEEGGECVIVANEVARGIADKAAELFADLNTLYRDESKEKAKALLEIFETQDVALGDALSILSDNRDYSYCNFIIDEASEPAPTGTRPLHVILVFLLAGILVAGASIACVMAVRDPIRSIKQVESAFDIRVLADSASSGFAERLWVNVELLSGEKPSVLAVLPLTGNSDDLQLVSDLRCIAEEKAGAQVLACQPLNESVDSVRIANRANATIIYAEAWCDSMPVLGATLKELRLANAKVAGVAFARGN